MRLILVRHGETDWNVQARYQGHTDVPLNGTGRAQATALGQRLAREKIDVLYASDLQRARSTAEAIASRHGLPVRSDPRLRELDWGDWGGLTHGEIEARAPRELAAWMADLMGAAPPGGESLATLAARVQGMLADIVSHHQGQTVLLVAHGGPLRVLLCLALGLELQLQDRFRLDSASLSELALYEEHSMLIRLNDTSHLERVAGEQDRASGLILVLGGARSGKSSYAQQLAQGLGRERVLYVATAEAGDEEMRERIERHRQGRPPGWRTLEAPRNVGQAIREQAGDAEVVLVDCLTMLVSNLLLEGAGEDEVLAQVRELAGCAQRAPHLIVISNEVGMGLVPPYPLGRAYRDLLGRANQLLAQSAGRVHLLVAGIPLIIKGELG